MSLILLSPALLVGLAALGIPVLLHLRPRRKARIVPFAAMQFLKPAFRRTSRRLKLQNWLLLLTKLLCFLLFILALTRPMLRSSAQGPEGPLDLLILLDNSYSMGYKDGENSRFEQARKAALDLLDSLGEGDRCSLMLCNVSPDLRFGKFLGDLATVRKELQAATLTTRTSNVGEAITQAISVLNSSDSASREVCILTDLQQFGWPEKPIGTDKLTKETSFYIVDLGRPASHNVAVVEIRAPEDVREVGKPIAITASVRNFGDESRDVRVRLSVGGKSRGERVVPVPGRSVASVAFSHTFEEPGPHSGHVSLSTDSLLLDDQRHFCVNIHEGIPVLCVDGDPSKVQFLSESFFLSSALAPGGKDAAAGSPFRPDVIVVDELPNFTLTNYKAVVFANVSRLGADQALTLDKYVNTGGRLLLFLGDRVDPAWYQRSLGALLPAALAGTEGTPDDKTKYVNLAEIDYEHPAFTRFKDKRFGDLGTAQFYKYFVAKVDESKQAVRVCAKFSNGLPALLEKDCGLGKVMLFVSTADAGWANFPLRPVFLPFVHHVASYLSGRTHAKRDYLVGDVVTFSLDLTEYGATVVVEKPNGEKEEIVGTVKANLTTAAFSSTERPGSYSAVFAGTERKQKDHLCVNVDTRESDLSRIDEEGVKKALGDVPVTIVSEPSKAAETIRKRREGIPLWMPLLYAALLLYFFESFLSGKFAKDPIWKRSTAEAPADASGAEASQAEPTGA